MNFERELSPEGAFRVVECQMIEQSLEHRQRDIYETHKHRAYAVAYYMTGNELEAEDVTEGTFTRAFTATAEPDGPCVDCALVDELRDRLPLDVEAPAAVSSPGGSLSGHNVKRTDMEEAVKDLPPNERIVFLLRDVEGYDAERVASLLGVTRSQVGRTLLSARIRMRTFLASVRVAAVAA